MNQIQGWMLWLLIREKLPKNGKVELEKIIKGLQQDNWNAPSDVSDGESHTSPMALVEIMAKIIDRDMGNLDYGEEVRGNRFGDIISFTASKESIQWLKDYISGMLQYARENAEYEAENGRLWNGWFQEKDWLGCQEHMGTLVSRLDELLTFPGNSVELLSLRQPEERQTLFTESEEEVLGAFSENAGISLK